MRERWSNALDAIVAELVAVVVVLVILAMFVAAWFRSWVGLLGIVCLLMATIWMRQRRRAQRARVEHAKRMLCPGCEYDLRGTNPDEYGMVRCPECNFAATPQEIEKAWETLHPEQTGRWNEAAWKER